MDWPPDMPAQSGPTVDTGQLNPALEVGLAGNGSQVGLSTLEHVHRALFQGDAATRQINWALAIVFTLVMLSTAVGNLFVIIAILVERNLRSVGNYLVLSLATADLLVALAVMPLASVYQIVDAWTLGVWLCEFWTSSDVFSCTASILHLLAIALDRYWAVTRVDYIRCQRNERHILCMIAIVWVTALIISLAPFFGWMDDNFESRITQQKECLVSQNLTYQMLATCATFFVPVTITLVLYWNIYQVARKRIRRKPGTRLKVSQQLPSSSSSMAGGGLHSPQRKQASSERLSSSVAAVSGAPPDDTPCVCSCHQPTSAAAKHLSGAPPAGGATSSTSGPLTTTTEASNTTVRLEDASKPLVSAAPTTNNQQTAGQSSPVQVTLRRPASSTGLVRENCCAPDDSASLSLNLSFTGGSPTKQQLLARIDSRGLLQSQLEAPPEGPQARVGALLGWLRRGLARARHHSNPDKCSGVSGCHLCAEPQQPPPPQARKSPARLALSVAAQSGTVETVAATTVNLAATALRPPMGAQLPNSIQFHSSAQEGIESKRERKAAKTLAIITGIFVICWLPFFSMALAMPLLDLQPPKYLFNLLMWLGYVNSMLNPIIYTIFSPDFRRAFKRLLCGTSSARPNHLSRPVNGCGSADGQLKWMFWRSGRLLGLRATLADCCLMDKMYAKQEVSKQQVTSNNNNSAHKNSNLAPPRPQTCRL